MNIKLVNLSVRVKEKQILDNLNLEIKPGTIHVIMGPNGVGKSTLSKVILGSNDYKITNGDIKVDEESILSLTTDERARLGIFLSFQNPIDIEGVTNSEFIRCAINAKCEEPISLYDYISEMNKNYDDLKLSKDLMHRSVNANFSGGEKHKNEILMMKMLKPKFIILDELDSGLDVDSLKIVCENVNSYLKENKDASVLMITHYQRMLDYIKPDYVHILKNGKIVESGDYTLAQQIDEFGYESLKAEANNISEE